MCVTVFQSKVAPSVIKTDVVQVRIWKGNMGTYRCVHARPERILNAFPNFGHVSPPFRNTGDLGGLLRLRKAKAKNKHEREQTKKKKGNCFLERTLWIPEKAETRTTFASQLEHSKVTC